MSTLSQLQSDLRSFIIPEKAAFFPRFFKTGKGQYGYGDKFLGITVPNMRTVAVKYKDLELSDIIKLLHSQWHEERLVALIILTEQFKRANPTGQKEIYDLYLSNTKYINNWDLVDLSATNIVGEYLVNKSKSILYKLAKSDLLWDRRIAIISTFAFIKRGDPSETFKIAEILLHDKHDLIHKAVGWMLREVGKRCGEESLESFLNKHYKVMPRTMLRYALERMSDKKKKFYMTKNK